MPDLDDLFNGRTPVTVEINGVAVRVAYNAGVFSNQFMHELEQSGTDRDLDRVVALLPRVLVEWDLTRRGKPIPITKEVLDALPIPILTAIGTAVLEDLMSSKNGHNLGATLPPTEQ